MRSKKAFKNTTLSVVQKIISIICAFIVPKLIISNFGSNINGLAASITQFLGYIVLLESGFGPVVVSLLYKPIAEKNKDEIENILYATEKFFRKIAIIFIIYIIFLVLIFPIIINKDFSFLFTASLIVIISISTLAEYFFGMTYKLFINANQESYVVSIIQIISTILNTILVILLIKVGSNIQIVKIGSAIAFVLRPILQNLYIKKKYNLKLKNANKDYVIKNKWDGLAQHIAAVIHNNTDITVLTLFASLIEVSIYSVYYLVVNGIKNILTSFNSGVEASFGDMIAKKEHDNLNKKFGAYENLYNMIITIAFACAIILIVPFVSVYTKGIKDANYIRYAFGVLIVISEYIWAIRLPYSSITLAAGHFKETRVGAWVECISNIVISVILVRKFGLIGVAIGTIVAMTIRTIEFVYHTNKYILDRSIWESAKKILLIIAETLIIVFICRYLPYVENINYINWIINAIMVATVASIVTLSLNFFFFKNESKEVVKIFKGILKRKSKNQAY